MFSSHILGDAEMICDRVAILHLGNKIAEGPMSDLLSTRIKEYEVAMTNPNDSLLEDVKKRAEKVVQRKNDLLGVFKTEADAQAILQRLLNGEGTLSQYLPRRESLEDYFIREIEEKRRLAKAQSSNESTTAQGVSSK
jgi:ABC-2 type transport system ATP-binding protein